MKILRRKHKHEVITEKRKKEDKKNLSIHCVPVYTRKLKAKNTSLEFISKTAFLYKTYPNTRKRRTIKQRKQNLWCIMSL